MFMQPNPRAETSRLLFPSFRFFILRSLFGVMIEPSRYYATFCLLHALLPDLLRYCSNLHACFRCVVLTRSCGTFTVV
jgi:hypothetical protein